MISIFSKLFGDEPHVSETKIRIQYTTGLTLDVRPHKYETERAKMSATERLSHKAWYINGKGQPTRRIK